MGKDARLDAVEMRVRIRNRYISLWLLHLCVLMAGWTKMERLKGCEDEEVAGRGRYACCRDLGDGGCWGDELKETRSVTLLCR